MKIAILTPEFVSESGNWHGGLANYLSRITRGLKDRGHIVHIFCYSSQNEVIHREGIIIHGIKANDFALLALDILTFGIFRDIFQILFIAYYFKKRFPAICRQEKFDVIHSSSCQTPALFLNSRKIGVPIVTRLSSITRLCQRISGRRNILDMFLLNLAEKHLARKSEKVFAPGRITKQAALSEYGIDIDLIESPEYFEDWDETKMDYSIYDRYFKNKKYIIYYGTLSRLKGAEFIAEIIYEFLEKYRNYYFVIIGKMEPIGKKTMPIEPILNNAKEFRDRIIYTNSLRHKLLFPVVKNAQAVFLPLLLDNFPNTMIESMSLGKIVIGTHNSGFDQLIKDGENGHLIYYGDKEKLFRIFDLIFRATPEEIGKMEKAARATVRTRLNFKEKMIELERYYIKAIEDFKK